MAAPYSRPAAAAELIRSPTVAPASATASKALSVSGMEISGTRDATEPAMSDAALFKPAAVAEPALCHAARDRAAGGCRGGAGHAGCTLGGACHDAEAFGAAHQHPGDAGADQSGGERIVADGCVQAVDDRACAIEFVLEDHRAISFAVATSRSNLLHRDLGFEIFRLQMAHADHGQDRADHRAAGGRGEMGEHRGEAQLGQPQRERDEQNHQHRDGKDRGADDIGRADARLGHLLRQLSARKLHFVLHELAELLDGIAEQPGDRIEVVRQRHDAYPSRRASNAFACACACRSSVPCS